MVPRVYVHHHAPGLVYGAAARCWYAGKNRTFDVTGHISYRRVTMSKAQTWSKDEKLQLPFLAPKKKPISFFKHGNGVRSFKSSTEFGQRIPDLSLAPLHLHKGGSPPLTLQPHGTIKSQKKCICFWYPSLKSNRAPWSLLESGSFPWLLPSCWKGSPWILWQVLQLCWWACSHVNFRFWSCNDQKCKN